MLYILLGADAYARDERMRALLSDIEYTCHFSYQGLEPWMTAVGQADLFGQTRALVGRDLLDEMRPADLQQLLDHVAANDSPDQLIIWLSQANSLNSEVAGHAAVVGAKVEVFSSLNQAQLVQWLRKTALEMGLSIESRLLPQIIVVLAGDRYALTAQLELWQLQGLKAIDGQAVAQIAPLAADASVFGLTDSWAQRQLDRSLAELERLTMQAMSASQIIAMLAWQVELLRAAYVLQDETSGSGLKAFNPVALQKAQRLTRQWTREVVDDAMVTLTRLDEQIKLGKVEGRLGVELWVTKTLS